MQINIPIGGIWFVFKRYGYAMWLGGICAAAGWQISDYQCWLAIMPVIILVVWHDD